MERPQKSYDYKQFTFYLNDGLYVGPGPRGIDHTRVPGFKFQHWLLIPDSNHYRSWKKALRTHVTVFLPLK